MSKPSGIKKDLTSAIRSATKEIHANSKRGGYAAGLASEGYAGGYLAALSDVRLALNGVRPNNSRYWPQE